MDTEAKWEMAAKKGKIRQEEVFGNGGCGVRYHFQLIRLRYGGETGAT